MGKLFNLKEWLTVADAARHLSIVFGEDVTEADDATSNNLLSLPECQ